MIEIRLLALALVAVLVGGCLLPAQPPVPEAVEVHGKILTEDAETLRARPRPGAVPQEELTPMSGRCASSDCLKQGRGGVGLSASTPPAAGWATAPSMAGSPAAPSAPKAQPAVGSVAAFETAGPRW